MTSDRFDRRLVRSGGAWCGRVVEVYASAAVAEPASGGGDRAPTRLTLLERGRPLVPFGIELRASPPLVVGQRVELSEGALSLCTSGGVHRCRLTGPGVELTERALGPAGPSSFAALVRQVGALAVPSRVQRLLGEERVPSTALLADRVLAVSAPRLQRLLDGLWGGARTSELAGAVRGLAGLGEGSTPTGDDLLVGVAASATRLAACGWLPLRSSSRLRAALGRLPVEVTTRVGHEMIAQAAAGAFPEPLLDFVGRLGNEQVKPRQLGCAMTRLLRMGSTSGADLLAGAHGLARRCVAGSEGEGTR